MADKEVTIYEALSNVQTELKAPKGQTNNFGNYKYRSAEDILEAVKPLLRANELTMVIGDKMVNLGDRYYVQATAVIYNRSGQSAQADGYAREAFDKKGMDDAQITGSASSYARKYALNGLFNIDDTKDADTNEYVNNAKPKQDADALAKRKAKLNKMLEDHDYTRADTKKSFIYGVLEKQTIDTFDDADSVYDALQNEGEASTE